MAAKLTWDDAEKIGMLLASILSFIRAQKLTPAFSRARTRTEGRGNFEAPSGCPFNIGVGVCVT